MDPRQTQTVQSCRFGVFLLTVLWSNKIAKSDLRRTYETTGRNRYQCTRLGSPLNERPMSARPKDLGNDWNVVNSVEKVSRLHFIALNKNNCIFWLATLNQYSNQSQLIGMKFRNVLADRLFQQNFVVS